MELRSVHKNVAMCNQVVWNQTLMRNQERVKIYSCDHKNKSGPSRGRKAGRGPCMFLFPQNMISRPWTGRATWTITIRLSLYKNLRTTFKNTKHVFPETKTHISVEAVMLNHMIKHWVAFERQVGGTLFRVVVGRGGSICDNDASNGGVTHLGRSAGWCSAAQQSCKAMPFCWKFNCTHEVSRRNSTFSSECDVLFSSCLLFFLFVCFLFCFFQNNHEKWLWSSNTCSWCPHNYKCTGNGDQTVWRSDCICDSVWNAVASQFCRCGTADSEDSHPASTHHNAPPTTQQRHWFSDGQNIKFLKLFHLSFAKIPPAMKTEVWRKKVWTEALYTFTSQAG